MTTPGLRAMNDDMEARILAQPAAPMTEGGYVLRAVSTRGRRSGEPRRTPPP